MKGILLETEKIKANPSQKKHTQTFLKSPQ